MIPPVDSHFRGARSFGEDADWVGFVERECEPEWPRQEAGCELSEALEIFCKLADFPTGDENLDGFAGKLRAAMHGYLSSAEVSDEKNLFFVSCISLLEPCIRRVLMLADPECYKQLHRPPPDWCGPNYNPTLSRFYDELGLKSTYKRIYAAANTANNVVEKICKLARMAKERRDVAAHVAREFRSSEIAEGFKAVWLTMLWVVAKYKKELESLLFVLTRKEYLEALKRRWQDHLRKWVLLEADELLMDDEPFLDDLTAGELAFESAEDTEDSYDKEFEELEEQEEFDDSANKGLHGEHDPSAREQNLRSGRVHDLFDQVGRLILTANAGAGKTTSLQHYAYVQADRLLEDPQRFRPLPLYVELRYYRQDGLWPLLINALRTADYGQRYDESQLQREVADGKWFLLLDGVNEVQSNLFEQALRELEQVVEQFGNARVVITGRGDVPLERLRLPVFKLSLLTDEQIKECLRSHFGTPEKAQQFEQLLRRNRRLWEWGRNPLQLWMLVVGLKLLRSLPENRGQLLRRFMDAILKRESTKGPQIPRDVKLDLLTELGYRIRLEAQVSFAREKAWQIIRDRAQTMGFQVDSARFIHEVCDNNLLSDQGEQLAFAHEMYQEYFAACGLKREYAQNRLVVQDLTRKPNWREPIVLLWELLDEPRDLFDQIVSAKLSLAAECLSSSAKEHSSEYEVLQDRIRKVGCTSSDDHELEDVLRAIYLIGDGELLADHLRHLHAKKRLKRVGRKIGRTVSEIKTSKPTTVVEATLTALEKLEGEASGFSQFLLAPLFSKELNIPRKTKERAVQLWYKWRDYQFALIHRVDLAAAFRLGELLPLEDTRLVIHELINQARFRHAKSAIVVFGRSQDEFVDAVISKIEGMLQTELCLAQLKMSFEGIRVFGLNHRFPPKPLVEEALKRRWYEVALLAIEAFKLTDDFPPGPIIEKLIMSGRDTIPVWYIRAFGLPLEMFADKAAKKVRRLLYDQHSCDLERILRWIKAFNLAPEQFADQIKGKLRDLLDSCNWKEALRWIKAFNLAPEQFANKIMGKLKYLLSSWQFDMALEWISAFNVLSEEVIPKVQEAVKKMIQKGNLELALRYIETCGLRREEFAQCVLEKALTLARQKQLDAAVRWIDAFGLSHEQLIRHVLKNDNLGIALKLIKRCGLNRADFETDAVASVEVLLSKRRFAEASGYIKAFRLENAVPMAVKSMLDLLEKEKWRRCVEAIKVLGLQVDQFLPEIDSRIRSLMAKSEWKRALQAIQSFDLDPHRYLEYVIPAVEAALRRAHLDSALTLVAEFKLSAHFPPEPIIMQLVRSQKWKAALRYIKACELQPDQFASGAGQLVRELLSKRRWREAIAVVNAFQLDRTFFAELAAVKARALLDNHEWEAASACIQVWGLDREQFIQSVAGHVENLLKKELYEVALRAIKTFGLQKRFSPSKIVRALCRRARLKPAIKAIKDFRLEKRLCAAKARLGIRKLLRSSQYEAALSGMVALGVWRRFVPDVARLIHSDRRSRMSFLRWFVRVGEKCVRFRNAVATCLLQEYQDVTNAVSLVRPMRMTRRQLRHNLLQRDRVEAIRKELAEDSSSLEVEVPLNSEPELFGYVLRGRVFAPGYGEFDIVTKEAKRWYRKVVQFRLVTVVSHETEDDTMMQSVLGAAGLRRPIRNQSA